MRFLKNKIALATASNNKKTQEPQPIIPQEPLPSPPQAKGTKLDGSYSTSEASRATKNIVKNYGRAICAFALSKMALPYLKKILEKEGVSLRQFTNYVKQIKGTIDGLFHFRNIILINSTDSPTLAGNKRVFVGISEVFVKFFSVNWIYNSRVFHKEAHLKFRFRVLRRIKHPELFTYLKETRNGRKSSY